MSDAAEADRHGLINKLLAVEPGLSRRETHGAQETCVVFRGGWAYTLNMEIACACPSGLDKNITLAVPAKKLLQALRAMRGDVVKVSAGPKTLSVWSNGDKARVVADPEITLKLNRVERPASWGALHADFGLAVARALKCVRTRGDDKAFVKSCVHVHPDWVEGCDNSRGARHLLATPVPEPSLVRGTTMKEVVALGPTQISLTPRWLHFRTPAGLRVSVRRHVPEQYPDLGEVLNAPGEELKLPKGLKGAAELAGHLADEGPDGPVVCVTVEESGRVTVMGRGVLGEAGSVRKIADYRGGPLCFRTGSRLLAGLTDERGTVTVSQKILKVTDGPYTYVTTLLEPRRDDEAIPQSADAEDGD